MRILLLIAVLAVLITGAPSTVQAQDASDAAKLMIRGAEAEGDGRVNQAVAFYRRAHVAAPHDPNPLIAWAALAQGLGADDEAARLYAAALDIDGWDARALNGLAETLVVLERPIEALALYQTLLHDDPHNGRAVAGRAAAVARIAETDPQTLSRVAGTEYAVGLAQSTATATVEQ